MAQVESRTRKTGSSSHNRRNMDDKHHRGWRLVVRNFTPSWFSITMGTGIVSILLFKLPFNGTWLYWLSVIVFVLNIALFCVFTVISLIRYILYPEILRVMIRHPVQSLFLGTIPMGLATIINMIVFVCVPAFGQWAMNLAQALWWIDVVLSVATAVYLPFVIITLHSATLSTMTAAWLLPIVSTIVAAASGGIVAAVLAEPSQLRVIITSYVLLGMGLPLSLLILVIYFQRLTMYHLPSREVIVSVFLPLGPLGQGGFAAEQLGAQALRLFPLTETLPQANAHAGEILYVVGWLTALVLWGFGIVWFLLAIASILRTRPFPFNMGWWGFTFPIGVFALSTNMMAAEMPSLFFRVLGTIFSVAVIFLWLLISFLTIQGAMKGELLSAPCLKDLEKDEEGPELDPCETGERRVDQGIGKMA